MTTLNSRIPDSVSVMTVEGFRMYKIDKEKYEQSLIKEARKRARLSTLFFEYPLSVDTLSMHWTNRLKVKEIPVQSNIRYVYTDLDLQNDTIYGKANHYFLRDSLTVSYLGFRCEKMEYISSSGLRIILTAHKKVTAKGGKFIVRNLTREVSSVIDLTGFSRILTIE